MAPLVVRRRVSSDGYVFRSVYPATASAPSCIHPRPIRSEKNGNNAKKSPHVQLSGQDGQFTVKRETANAVAIHPNKRFGHPFVGFSFSNSSIFPVHPTRAKATSQLYFHIRAENSSAHICSSIFALLSFKRECLIAFKWVRTYESGEKSLAVKKSDLRNLPPGCTTVRHNNNV